MCRLNDLRCMSSPERDRTVRGSSMAVVPLPFGLVWQNVSQAFGMTLGLLALRRSLCLCGPFSTDRLSANQRWLTPVPSDSTVVSSAK
ncbi:hypothetical protein Q7C36_017920 [Tachysurus vachellii]|uniref:Uncharacterized protein n=1 Tax=Tachysurus vachellii TaxID=175792 RepID=A0AA88SC65_TACVA|nr:hypothetical protein Q7C36_017920 [Tachysurus vachellii]